VNSFIFSFRPLLTAVAIAIAIETSIALVARPNLVERSNYLNWTYAQPDPFHKFTAYAKMREVLSANVDVVQVGDSSGFHGIRPDIVTAELSGMRYFNLSTVANTGFDGYYDFVRFALLHNPKLQAIVLYMSLNFLPKPGMIGGDVQLGAAKIHEAYVGPWSLFALPSMALRPVVTDGVYTLFGVISPRRNGLSDSGEARDMIQSVQREHGWWAEHDSRQIGDRNQQFFRRLCGPNDTANLSVEGLSDAEGHFLPAVLFDKFAALAKSYDKKLVIVLHPHPCSHLNVDVRRRLETSITALKSKYPNVSVYPEHLFEHWPREVFTQAEHLYVGYERYASRRLARFLAAAMGRPSVDTQEEPPLPRTSPLRDGESPVWQSGRIDGEWHLEGLLASLAPESGWRIVETERNERHYFETRISGLQPGHYYLVAVSYLPLGERMINVTLRDARHEGMTWCDPKALDAGRRGDFYDGSMMLGADGTVTCWGIIKLDSDPAFLGIDILPGGGGFPYQGDGRSGILLRNIRIFQRSSADVVMDSPPGH
jgi:hypothetical protein